MLARQRRATYRRGMINAAEQEAARRSNAEGLAAIRDGNLPAAIAALTLATAADPRSGALWRNLAHAHRLARNDANERVALDRALALDRVDFAANLRLAQLHQRRAEEVAALAAWKGVLQLAEQAPNLAPAISAELDAGRAYLATLQAKLAGAADAALASLADQLDETARRRVGAFVDVALGRRRIYHNHCAGFEYPFLPHDEFFDRRHFPWFAQLESAAPIIRAELNALVADGDETLRPYVNLDDGSPAGLWSELDGSLDWSVAFLWEYGAANTPIIERCPQTAALLESLPLARIPGRAPNVFFSFLRPGRRIPPHTGVTNTRAIIHLGLDIPPGCAFRVGGETRAWVDGQAFAFDDTIEHEAWNDSERRRAVLILDAWNPHLTDAECAAVTTYLSAADAALGAAPAGL